MLVLIRQIACYSARTVLALKIAYCIVIYGLHKKQQKRKAFAVFGIEHAKGQQVERLPALCCTRVISGIHSRAVALSEIMLFWL